jgi:hypothetical protein
MTHYKVGENCTRKSFITYNPSPSISRTIKSRKVGLAGHVASVGGRSIYMAFMGKAEGR